MLTIRLFWQPHLFAGETRVSYRTFREPVGSYLCFAEATCCSRPQLQGSFLINFFSSSTDKRKIPGVSVKRGFRRRSGVLQRAGSGWKRDPLHFSSQSLQSGCSFELVFLLVPSQVLVFCTTARITALLAEFYKKLGMNTLEIHSRKSQSFRNKVSDEFRKSPGGVIMFTSDVSARGVDYPDVTLVLQVPSLNHISVLCSCMPCVAWVLYFANIRAFSFSTLDDISADRNSSRTRAVRS